MRIEERYYYRQQISRNPSAAERRDPTGRIKIVIPYDGERFFTRQAHRDVARAQRLGADRDPGALVGFLALTGYDDTDLESLLNLEAYHGSVPIKVQLPSAPGPHRPDPLLADNSSCVVAHDYQPGHRTGQPIPVRIGIDLDDPDTIGILPLPDSITRELHASIARQASFKPDLTLRIDVHLTMPCGLAVGARAAERVFVGRPTRTSLGSLELRVNGQKHPFRYNPQRAKTGGLEWRDVPTTAEPEPLSGDISVFSGPHMLLSIPNPGDLYRHNTLEGEVEVTVNRLLSGTDARLFDVT